jgi:hypothetical protein
MNNAHKIVWLASYPKSGNTWFRVFLANYLSNSNTPADINSLEGGPIASSRQLFDEATGLSSADLTAEEIENLRPEVYKYIAAQSKELLFHKIHDAFTKTSSGMPLIPEEATNCVLYFIRNPLDVAVSFSHHSNVSCEIIVKQMNDNNYAFCKKADRLHNQLCQKLLTWSNHVKSWVDTSGLRLKVIRYEDMKTNPFETFKAAIAFAGMPCDDEKIEKALKFSDFNILQQQEEEKGFKEKSPKSKSFFRKGITGSWKTELSPALVNQIICDHREMMERFGYLDGEGNVVE